MSTCFTKFYFPRLEDSESTQPLLVITASFMKFSNVDEECHTRCLSCIVEHYNDGILIGRALAKSASEFENSNYGLVSDKESLVKEMLERVRVEARDE
ncbi:hypothetical protein PVK06_047253 [Gossypium arboreum]|uniref:Uncharacterized protein n=1 Tax=Gossypium arboreum TaxID=29729 RepID=A0ABR0MFE8_GOSAR|nr:hypothetical protein PVK06_047253 [Gossypium arboreum]